MTPEQFAAKMRYISQLPATTERTRIRLIECMADALEDMGYKEGVGYFRKIEEEDDNELSELQRQNCSGGFKVRLS